MLGFSVLYVWFLVNLVESQTTKPNFVFIFADDMGYGDLHSYGHPSQEKGSIDVLADEGMRFTQWYSADSLCTPSRTALLTGRLPLRSGMVGPERVLWQHSSGGLPKSEITIAEALQSRGYYTGMVGKWHLGINEHVQNDGNHLPHHHGFDYVGTFLPFTYHFLCDPAKFPPSKMSRKCFLFKNSTFVQQPIEPEELTRRLAHDAVEFIRVNRTQPFFLYVSMPQVHVAMMCTSQFCGKSRRGIFGDQVNEMAWLVEEVIRALRDMRIQNNTLVFFVSDHGPQTEMCFHGGSSGFLKGGKGTCWDGGIRVPSIAWWPGTIPAGTVNYEVLSTMDIFPTFLKLAGGNVSDYAFDGVPIDHILLGNKTDNSTKPAHEILYHYCSDKLMAVRLGRYKIHFHTHDLSREHTPNCVDGDPIDDVLHHLDCDDVVSHDPPLMFDLETDPGEHYPLDTSRHENVLARSRLLISEHQKSIVSVPSQLSVMREDLQPCCNPPSCLCNYSAPSDVKTEL